MEQELKLGLCYTVGSSALLFGVFLAGISVDWFVFFFFFFFFSFHFFSFFSFLFFLLFPVCKWFPSFLNLIRYFQDWSKKNKCWFWVTCNYWPHFYSCKLPRFIIIYYFYLFPS